MSHTSRQPYKLPQLGKGWQPTILTLRGKTHAQMAPSVQSLAHGLAWYHPIASYVVSTTCLSPRTCAEERSTNNGPTGQTGGLVCSPSASVNKTRRNGPPRVPNSWKARRGDTHGYFTVRRPLLSLLSPITSPLLSSPLLSCLSPIASPLSRVSRSPRLLSHHYATRSDDRR